MSCISAVCPAGAGTRSMLQPFPGPGLCRRWGCPSWGVSAAQHPSALVALLGFVCIVPMPLAAFRVVGTGRVTPKQHVNRK